MNLGEPPDDLDRALHEMLLARRDTHQLRERSEVHPIDATHVQIDGRRYTNFASNNYLGLTHHPRLREAVVKSLSYGTGSAAAGLITGYTDLHRAAEDAIAKWKGTQACVILPSGYQANIAAIQTLAAVGDVRFLLDKLIHASLLDAVRATGAAMRVFPHNHLPKLRRLLEDAPSNQMQVVLTESIFSMDGDAADLVGLAELKAKRPFVLLLDEAHGSGVYGARGAGYAAECGLQNIVDVSIVTLSKALGGAGGAVCGSQHFCDALLNLGRAYIYSTSVPPMIPAMAQAAIAVCGDEPHRQRRVRELSRHVRDELARRGMMIPLGDSPIIPLICGEETVALNAANALREEGILVVAVRPPTVPRGSSRLRITLSCDHTDGEVSDLLDTIARVHIPG